VRWPGKKAEHYFFLDFFVSFFVKKKRKGSIAKSAFWFRLFFMASQNTN